MNIAFGFDIFYPETNGVISATINHARNLIDLGHKVYFFVPYEKEFKEEEIENGIKIIRIRNVPLGIYKGLKILPFYGGFLLPYLEKYKIDIVHNTSPWLMGVALNEAARKAHIPSLATHHTLIDDPTYMRYALKSKFLSKATKNLVWKVLLDPFYSLSWLVTAPSKNTCEELKKNLIDKDVRFVSNGIDLSRFDNDECADIPEEIDRSFLGDKTFIYIGRLGYEKAIDIVVKAFALCLRNEPDAHLIIIGDGPARDDIKDLVSSLFVKDKVLMTGKIENDKIIGSGILKKVFAFVTASLTENQAMTVIEALCSALPVIAADCPNMRALFTEKEGYFFTGGDEKSLASVMLASLSNREERNIRSRNALILSASFDGKFVTEKFIDIYNELLDKKKEGFCVKGGEKYVKNKN